MKNAHKMTLRLYINFNPGTPQIQLDADQSHYVRTVLRQSAGNTIHVFNETHGEYKTIISGIDKKSCTLILGECLRMPMVEPITRLLFAPLKHDAMAFLFEKGTELGVTHFCPIITDHSQNYKFNTDKIVRQLTAAVQQCERLSVPMIENPIRFDNALEFEINKNTHIFIGMERLNSHSMFQCLNTLGAANNQNPCTLIIGPEGGFSDRERTYVMSKSAIHTVSLGQTILRAETAALAGLAALSMWRV